MQFFFDASILQMTPTIPSLSVDFHGAAALERVLSFLVDAVNPHKVAVPLLPPGDETVNLNTTKVSDPWTDTLCMN